MRSSKGVGYARMSYRTQEIFGEMQEALARTKARRPPQQEPDESGSPGKSMLVWGFIGIISHPPVVLLFKEETKHVTEELNTLKGRVEQMEKRLQPLTPQPRR